MQKPLSNAVALGHFSRTDRDNSVSVGNAEKNLYRQITHVADGTENNDAVTLGQVKKLIDEAVAKLKAELTAPKAS